MGCSVLVTDAEQRSALAVVRSLGRAGHHVSVCSARSKPLAAASRFAARQAVVVDPFSDPDRFVADLGGLIEDWGIDVLLPVTDAACEAVLPRLERLGGVTIPLPDAATFRAISDKAHAAEVARAVGIATPEETILREPGAPIPDALPYPLAIKPSRSIAVHDSGRLVRQGVRYAADRPALEAALARVPAPAFPVLLQQRVDGPGVGVFLLRWNGEIFAEFSHLRIREKPPTGGVSVYREGIPVDPSLRNASVDLLNRFDWQGVAMVEFKRDRATGVHYLMEVNGRFWGSLQLAVDSGVDFPRLLVDLARGDPVDPVREYRTGIRSRWWWGDVDQLLWRMRRRGANQSRPPVRPGLVASVLAFARVWWPGDRPEVFRWTDRGPFWRESAQWFKPGLS